MPDPNEQCERRTVISGIGHSAIGRQIERSGFQLTLDAICAAVADAGLVLDDIDGISAFPSGGGGVPGASNPDLAEIHEALRLTTSWSGGVGSAGPLSGAVMAVATGQARHVVLYRTVKEGSAGRRAGGRPAYGSTSPTAAGALAWVLPIGGLSVACQLAPIAARYMHDTSSDETNWPGYPSRNGLTPRQTRTGLPGSLDRRGLFAVADDLDAVVPV